MSSKARQQGFTLVEIAIVSAIVLISAVIGIPAISGYIIENKVPALGQELQRFVARTKAGVQGLGATPYADMGSSSLVNSLRNSSVVTVSGTGAGAEVRHGVGATDGKITLTPDTLTTLGDSFSINLDKVNDAACPGLASVMQRVSERITVNGTSVKQPGAGGISGSYNATAADAACIAGDANAFTFTAR